MSNGVGPCCSHGMLRVHGGLRSGKGHGSRGMKQRRRGAVHSGQGCRHGWLSWGLWGDGCRLARGGWRLEASKGEQGL